MRDEDIIKGNFADMLGELDEDQIRRKAKMVSIFYQTLVEGDMDEDLIHECVMSEFYSFFMEY